MKNSAFLFYLLFFLFLGWSFCFSQSPTPPPPTSGNQTFGSSEGVILDGSIEHNGDSIIGRNVTHIVDGCMHSGTVDSTDYVTVRHLFEFRMDTSTFWGDTIWVRLSVQDTFGNPILANFQGNVGSSFSRYFEPATGNTDLDAGMTCYGRGVAHRCAIKFEIWMNCLLPDSFPTENNFDIAVNFRTNQHERDFLIQYEVCTPNSPVPSYELKPFRKTSESADLSQFFELAPVPFHDFVTIHTQGHLEGKLRFGLFDLYGKKIMQSDWLAAHNSLRWELPDLANGLYLLQVEDGLGKHQLKKVLKQ